MFKLESRGLNQETCPTNEPIVEHRHLSLTTPFLLVHTSRKAIPAYHPQLSILVRKYCGGCENKDRYLILKFPLVGCRLLQGDFYSQQLEFILNILKDLNLFPLPNTLVRIAAAFLLLLKNDILVRCKLFPIYK